MKRTDALRDDLAMVGNKRKGNVSVTGIIVLVNLVLAGAHEPTRCYQCPSERHPSPPGGLERARCTFLTFLWDDVEWATANMLRLMHFCRFGTFGVTMTRHYEDFGRGMLC